MLHLRLQASPKSGGLAAPIGVTRPKRVRFRYGSHVRLPRLRTTDCSFVRPVGYLVNGLFQGKLLSACWVSQAWPGAPNCRGSGRMGPRGPILPASPGRFLDRCWSRKSACFQRSSALLCLFLVYPADRSPTAQFGQDRDFAVTLPVAGAGIGCWVLGVRRLFSNVERHLTSVAKHPAPKT